MTIKFQKNRSVFKGCPYLNNCHWKPNCQSNFLSQQYLKMLFLGDYSKAVVHEKLFLGAIAYKPIASRNIFLAIFFSNHYYEHISRGNFVKTTTPQKCIFMVDPVKNFKGPNDHFQSLYTQIRIGWGVAIRPCLF